MEQYSSDPPTNASTSMVRNAMKKGLLQ